MISASNIQGKFYSKGSSKWHNATLRVFDNFKICVTLNDSKSFEYDVRTVSISPRVANTERLITFPDGNTFSTFDNDTIDVVVQQYASSTPNKFLKFLHYLESHIAVVIPSIVMLLLFIYFIIYIAMPALVKGIAFSVPSSTLKSIAHITLDYLDTNFFESSSLSIYTRDTTQNEFISVVKHIRVNDYEFVLTFRNAPGLGPNAFALPDGTIVITDDMVKLIKSKDELKIIFAHEIAHVLKRHGLQSILLNSGILIIFIAISGDVVSTASIGLPVLLIHNGYSRQFEKEADQFALQFCTQHNINPKHFASLLKRLEKYTPPGALSWLSTHPSTEERINFFTTEE